jgi:hypothetical protein
MTWLPESEAPLAQETREGGKEMQRMLPNPIANAANFVCFEEERMDICRAVISVV